MTIHILLNISRGKGNQTLKFGQLIEYNKRNIFLEKSCRNIGRETSSRPLFIFLKSFIKGQGKLSVAQFQSFSIVPSLTNNKNKIYKLQNIDPGICSILIIQERVWEQFLHHILCMIFQEKCFKGYILVTDQFSLPGCPICVLQLFFDQFVTSQTLKSTNIFLMKPFSQLTKKSRQKFKYLGNEKSF